MASEPQVVIDLCDDEDDFPQARRSTSSFKKPAAQQASGRPKERLSTTIDLSESPQPKMAAKVRANVSHPSSQASDMDARARKRQTSRSPHMTKNHDPRDRSGSASRNLSSPKDRQKGSETSSTKLALNSLPKAPSSSPLKNHKRSREPEELSSDSGRPDKRQRSLALGTNALSSPREQLKSRQAPGLKAPSKPKQSKGEVIDLTSDHEEDGAQVTRGNTTNPNDKQAVNSRPSPKPAKGTGVTRENKSPASARPRQTLSSPTRKKHPPNGALENGGAEPAPSEEPGAEIPESLPGTPETDKKREQRLSGMQNSASSLRMRDAASPSKAAPAAVRRLVTEASPGPAPWPNTRPLPLTPSESSADEDARGKTRTAKKQTSSTRPSNLQEPSMLEPPENSEVQKRQNVDVPKEKSIQQSQTSSPIPPSLQPHSSTANTIAGSRVADTTAGPMNAIKATTRRVEKPVNSPSNALSRKNATGPVVSKKPPLITPNMSISEQVERVTGHRLDELQRDNEHWARTLLHRARTSADSRTIIPNGDSTSVFSRMKPLPLRTSDGKKTDKSLARFETEMFRGTKKPTWAVPFDAFETEEQDVPNYSHYAKLKHNFLAPNETTLQHWPYFDDETNSDPTLSKQFGKLFSLDLAGREQKLHSMLRAESFAEYVEQMLRDLRCGWSDVLRFLLDPAPDMGPNVEARKALQNRDSFCNVSSYRKKQPWQAVLDKLPAPLPEKTAKAGILCERFNKLTGLSFWHVVRRSDYTRSLLDDEEQQTLTQDELTCRVCFRFSCPYHGEIENPNDEGDEGDDDSRSEASSEKTDVVATDIINPPTVNYRSRVALPPSIDITSGNNTKDRRSLHYWTTGANSQLVTKPDARYPFFPCHHPGLSCSGAQCSCHTNKVSCEKSCACSADCARKFQGCNCAAKGKVCFETDNCACWNLGRECDPDLCGDCGVCDVLDPKHRHEDRILIGRCHNASIQRGVPKHTMIGKSELHGFGLYLCEDVREHDFIGEYKGEVITRKEADRRGAIYEHQKLSYLFSLNNSQEVDSTYYGNKMRFINHASKLKQNVYARIITVNTVHRIGLFAQRDIRHGEELCFDYGPLFTTLVSSSAGEKGKKRGGNVQDQTQTKAVPHVRNANITKSFIDPGADGRGGGLAAQKSLGRPTHSTSRRGSQLARLHSSSSDVEMVEVDDDEDDDYLEDDGDD